MSNLAIAKTAGTLIGQAVFTNIEQYIKKHTKPLNWHPQTYQLFSQKDISGTITKMAAFCGKKKFSGPGIVVIKDVESGKLAVCSTVELALFITEFSYDNIDSGKYGEAVQKMKVVELFVHECESTSSARNGANKLRTRIRQAGLSAK